MEFQARMLRKELANRLAFMRAPLVPHDQDRAGDLLEQFAQERRGSLVVHEVLGIRLEAERHAALLGREAECGDQRDFFAMSAALLQDRRPAGRRERASHQRRKQHPALVDQDEMRAELAGSFLR